MSAQERKASIVESAIRLFGEKGFRGTTTRELAAAVGVTEPVLYEHFATKRELYNAIIESICEAGKKDADPELETARIAEDDVVFFSRLGELLLEWHNQETQKLRLLLFSALEGHELTELFYERQIAVYYRMLTDYIERRIEAKAFRGMDPFLAARAFTGMIAHQGMAMTIFGLRDLNKGRKQMIQGMVNIFLDGIRSPRS